MVENTPSEALLRELGAEVRQLRERAGLSQRELARQARISAHSRVSEMESGKRLLAMSELERIFDQLGADASERERLLDLARSAESPGELLVGSPGVSRTLAQLIDYERVATRIVDASPLLIPGLLQTSDYARAIMGDEPDSELRVALRSGRRDILTRRNPVELLALIDSEALVRPVVHSDVMADQLRHILRLAELPNVTVQVISSTTPGYHAMLANAFELIEFAKARPVVLLDHHRSSAFLRQEDDVAIYAESAEHIRRKVAMTPQHSVEVIANIVRGMETT